MFNSRKLKYCSQQLTIATHVISLFEKRIVTFSNFVLMVKIINSLMILCKGMDHFLPNED